MKNLLGKKFIILAVMAVVLGLAACGGGGSDETDNSNDTNINGDVGNGVSGASDRTNDTVLSSLNIDGLSVSDTVIHAGVEFTLDRVERFMGSDDFFVTRPQDGYEIILLWFTIQNISTESRTVNMFFADAYLDRFAVNELLLVFGVEGESLWGDIYAGMGRYGFVAFELPVGWQELQWHYYDWFSESPSFAFVVTPDCVE